MGRSGSGQLFLKPVPGTRPVEPLAGDGERDSRPRRATWTSSPRSRIPGRPAMPTATWALPRRWRDCSTVPSTSSPSARFATPTSGRPSRPRASLCMTNETRQRLLDLKLLVSCQVIRRCTYPAGFVRAWPQTLGRPSALILAVGAGPERSGSAQRRSRCGGLVGPPGYWRGPCRRGRRASPRWPHPVTDPPGRRRRARAFDR